MKLDLLLHLAKKTGLWGTCETSTNTLAKETKYSQQSISRLLISLEQQGFLTRTSSGKGVSITLTEKARTQLQHTHETLQSLFEPVKQLQGKVFNGLGEGAHYVKIYAKKIQDTIGFTPHYGTLNLRCTKENTLPFLRQLKAYHIKEFKQGDRTYGSITLYPVRVQGRQAAILRPDRTSYDQNVIELIATENLRETLHLAENDTLEVTQ